MFAEYAAMYDDALIYLKQSVEIDQNKRSNKQNILL